MSFLLLCVVNFLLPLVRRRFLEPVSVDLWHFELEWTNVHFEPLLFAHLLPLLLLFVVLLFPLLGLLLVFAAAILRGQAVSVWYMVWRRGYRRRVARVPLQLIIEIK